MTRPLAYAALTGIALLATAVGLFWLRSIWVWFLLAAGLMALMRRLGRGAGALATLAGLAAGALGAGVLFLLLPPDRAAAIWPLPLLMTGVAGLVADMVAGFFKW